MIDRNLNLAETKNSLNFGLSIMLPKPKPKFRFKLGQCKTKSLSVLSVSRVFGLFEFLSTKEIQNKTGVSYSRKFRESYRKYLQNKCTKPLSNISITIGNIGRNSIILGMHLLIKKSSNRKTGALDLEKFCIYSQTCVQLPPLRPGKSGHCSPGGR